MADQRFDLIIVGGGVAGISAAIIAASKGIKVILFEKGEHPGSKNVMGGVLYRQATEEVVPGFWREAPIERPVIEQNYWFLAEASAVKIGYRSQEFAKEPYNNFTVLRAKFDNWLGKKAEEAGALVITETVVDELITDGERVVGVKTGRPEGEVLAPLTIIAEGANSLLTQQAGLRNDISPQHLAVAVKEIIALPKETIESRFNLDPGMGAVIELIGDNTYGMMGTGFVYTNQKSISIGVGAILSEMVARKVNPNHMLEHMKSHPSIKPLIEGGETKEYLAKLIPEGGYRAMPKIYAPGLMVVGDAAMLVNGIHREGSNLAMLSGKYAAETAAKALERGDFSLAMLANYQKLLEDSFVLKDLKKYQNATGLFEENPQYFREYPEMMNDVLHEFFTIDNVPKREKQRIMMEKIKKRRSLGRLAGDVYKAWRVLG